MRNGISISHIHSYMRIYLLNRYMDSCLYRQYHLLRDNDYDELETVKESKLGSSQ